MSASSDPLISVIMPAWQPRIDWLQMAIDSVLAQQSCRLELIVVDDGCDPVVESLIASRDTRIRVVRIDHGGQASACNAGIAAARGRWIRFVDADDVVPPDSMARLTALMDGDRIIAYGATLVCDETLRPRSIIASTLTGDVTADCLLARFHVRHPAMLFPKSVVERAGGWAPLGVSSDWDFVLRTLEHAAVRGDRAVVLHYRRHDASMTGTSTLDAAEDSWREIVTRYFCRHPGERGTGFERAAWATLYGTSARRYARAGRYVRALDRFAQAAREHPAIALREAHWPAAIERGRRAVARLIRRPAAPIPPIAPTLR